MVRCSWWQWVEVFHRHGEEGERQWWRVLSLGCELRALRIAMQGCVRLLFLCLASQSWAWGEVWTSCGAAALEEPRNGRRTSTLWYQHCFGHGAILSCLKFPILNHGQKCCLLERFLQLLICWWLCEFFDKRRAASFWRCDKHRWYLLWFMLALSG